MAAVAAAGRSGVRRRRAAMSIGLLLLVAIVPALFALRVASRERSLREHGTVTQAVVLQVDTSHDTDYLLVGLLDCGCRVWVATSRPSAHPLGSQLAVRYVRHGRAEALVDRPNPYGPLFAPAAGIGIGILILAPLVVVALRRQRRARRLLDEPSTARVRFEAWERAQSNTSIPYLSVYPLDAPVGGPPIVAFSITRETLNQLQSGTALAVHGSLEPGEPVAFRADDVQVVPSGKTRSPEWEARHRQPLATIELSASGDAPKTVTATPLLLDPADARSWRRMTAALRVAYAVVAFGPAFRVLPEHLLPYAVVVIVVIVVALYGTLWAQRRLLDRLASRLPGPPPQGRRARRAACSAVARHLGGDRGRREVATQLGTTPERLAAIDRRWAIAMFVAIGLAALVFVGVLVSALLSV